MSEFTTCALFLSESIGNYTHIILFNSTYHKGYSVYADGKIEQWGTLVEDLDIGVSRTITFAVVFSQTVPSVIAIPFNNPAQGHYVVLRTPSTTDFAFASGNHSNKGFCWQANGY